MPQPTEPPTTPDERYIVVRGRLWRRSDPFLPHAERAELLSALGRARSDKKLAMASGDDAARADARKRVDEAKRALGERGPVWWTDGAPDYNRHLIENSPYAEWWRSR